MVGDDVQLILRWEFYAVEKRSVGFVPSAMILNVASCSTSAPEGTTRMAEPFSNKALMTFSGLKIE